MSGTVVTYLGRPAGPFGWSEATESEEGLVAVGTSLVSRLSWRRQAAEPSKGRSGTPRSGTPRRRPGVSLVCTPRRARQGLDGAGAALGRTQAHAERRASGAGDEGAPCAWLAPTRQARPAPGAPLRRRPRLPSRAPRLQSGRSARTRPRLGQALQEHTGQGRAQVPASSQPPRRRQRVHPQAPRLAWATSPSRRPSAEQR